MPSRADDWLRQALRDLAHARNTVGDGVYEWAAFAAQQAAEKAVKGQRARRFLHRGGGGACHRRGRADH